MYIVHHHNEISECDTKVRKNNLNYSRVKRQLLKKLKGIMFPL